MMIFIGDYFLDSLCSCFVKKMSENGEILNRCFENTKITSSNDLFCPKIFSLLQWRNKDFLNSIILPFFLKSLTYLTLNNIT